MTAEGFSTARAARACGGARHGTIHANGVAAEPRDPPMNPLIAFALKHRLLMLGLFVGVTIGGLIAFRQLNIEAYPDPTPPMVDVVTQSPGLSAEEIERYITIPIETQTAAIKN